MVLNISPKNCLISFLYVFIFVVSFLVYTHNNDFSYLYHTTEETKIAQITTHEYNLYHPLLMLDTAEVIARLSGAETYQEKVIAGRLASAIFASSSVIILMIIAHMISGIAGAVAAGILLPFSPMMIRLSHYFKEDPTFVFGITLSFLAVAVYYRKSSFRNFIFMILAMVIAASGKYVGFALLPMGIAVAILRPYRQKFRAAASATKRIGIFLSVYIVSYLVMNFQIFMRIDYIMQKLFPKVAATAAKKQDGIVALSGHGGAMVTHPWIEYIRYFFNQTGIVIPLLVVAYLVYFAFTFRKRTPVEKFMVAFLFLFTAVLSMGKVASGQYFLPQEMTCHFFAGIAIVLFLAPVKQRFGNRVFVSSLASCLVLVAALLFPYAEKSLHQFQPSVDTRKALLSWMELNLGNDPAKIASDKYVLLPDVLKWSQSLSSRKNLSVVQMEYTGDLKTLINASSLGYTHVAVSASTYSRFFSSSASASVAGGSIYDTRRKFYSELFEKGTLLWEANSPYGGIVNTPIRLYKLPPVK